MPPGSSPDSSSQGVAGGRDFAVSGILKPDDVQGLLPPGLRAEPERVARLAEQHGVFVVGVPPRESGP